MDIEKVDCFLINNGNKFPEDSLASLRERMSNADQQRDGLFSILQLKDPNIALILSLFVGTLGIDRFYIGDIKLGIVKLITCGGAGVWTIIDWFLITEDTRKKNLQKINPLL